MNHDMGGMDHGMSPLGDAGDVTYPHYLVNGRVPAAPRTLTAKPAQKVRLRVVNASSDTIFKLALQQIETLISKELPTVMQLLGFNYRRAIGEPLTTLVGRLILAQSDTSSLAAEITALQARQNILHLEVAKSAAAFKRLKEMRGIVD